VGFYGSFTQNGTFNLLLQFADGGTLLDFYQKAAPPREVGDIRQFWKNIFAVMKGLHRVHQSVLSYEDGEYRG